MFRKNRKEFFQIILKFHLHEKSLTCLQLIFQQIDFCLLFSKKLNFLCKGKFSSLENPFFIAIQQTLTSCT